MDLTTAKGVTAALMFLMTLLFGVVVPFLVLRSTCCSHLRTSPQFGATALSYLNCFVGGVFLGTTLLHMLPEARENFQKFQGSLSVGEDFPLTEVMLGAGFFLIVFLENVLMIIYYRSNRPRFDNAANQENRTHTPVSNEQDSTHNDSNQQKHTHKHSSPKVTYGAVEENQDSCSSGELDGIVIPSPEKQALLKKSTLKSCKSHEHIDVDVHSFRTIVLLLALCVHTIFEGLAVGLLKDQAETWSLAGAILAHKLVISFSLGTQVLRITQNLWTVFVYLFIFGIMCPFGIVIGLVVDLQAEQDGSQAANIASAFLQALAGGTFVYVTFFEFLNKELSEIHNLFKVLLIVVGFSCMLGVVFLE